MGKFCTRCGSPLEEGQACRQCAGETYNPPGRSAAETFVLKEFLLSMKNRMGIGDPENDSAGIYERGKSIIPDCIKANEGEIPVKQYNIAVLRTRLKLMRAEGRMQVTNKRLIFRATGRSIAGRTTLQHEFSVDEIAGIETKRDFRFSILDFLFGFIVIAFFACLFAAMIGGLYVKTRGFAVVLGCMLGFAGLVPFFLLYKKFLLKLLPLGASLGSFAIVYVATSGNSFIFVLAIISFLVTLFGLFLFSFKPNLVISIKTKSAVPAVDVRCELRASFFGVGSSGFAEVMPTDETEGAIREIGSIITDIQKLGDFGIEKWKI